jgi:methionine aminopeptidase
MQEIKEKYPSEPFAVRWLSNVVDSKFSLYAAISELVRAGAIESHPVLIEVTNGLVAQTESLMLVEKDGCKVLTKGLN